MWKLLSLSSCFAVLVATDAVGQSVFDGEDPESIAKFLNGLKPPGEAETRKLIVALAADDFATRQKAVNELARLANQSRDLLEKIREETDDPEVKKGLGRVLSRPAKPASSVRPQDAADAVFRRGHRGLGAELAGAVSSETDRAGAEKVIGAARASADEADRAGLVALLGSSEPITRETAARVLGGLGGDGLKKTLTPLLADASPMVRLAALKPFLAAADPACLPVLADLAADGDFYVRWRAADMLRQISGGEIEIDPLAVPAPVELGKWKDAKGWKVPATPSPITLLGEERKITEWQESPMHLFAEIQIKHHPEGFVRSNCTSHCAWGSKLRFRNYRLRLDWRFPVGDAHCNAGLALGKFKEVIPNRFAPWDSKDALEVEIRQNHSGNLFHHGFQMLAGGKPPGEHVEKLLPSNEDINGWNSMEIEERDGVLRVFVNGMLQNHVTGLSDTLTAIGLRCESYLVDFRNVTLEPLPGSVVAGEVKAPEKVEEAE